MAVVVQSVSTGAHTLSNLVITKPSGLTVGDLMLACIQGRNATVGTPSGWTLIVATTSAGNTKSWMYWKIADSSDVSATDFTWTNGDGRALGGGILRIDGHNSSNPVQRFANQSLTGPTSTPSFSVSVTPDSVNSLLVFFLGTADGTQNTASAYAIATSNPTWTEKFDIVSSMNDAGYQQASVATATRPEVTATGNASCTISASVDGDGLQCIMLVVRPTFTSTTSETLTTTEIVNKNPNKVSLEVSTMSETMTDEKDKIWDNQSKNSSSWTNQTKN